MNLLAIHIPHMTLFVDIFLIFGFNFFCGSEKCSPIKSLKDKFLTSADFFFLLLTKKISCENKFLVSAFGFCGSKSKSYLLM